MYLIGSSRAPGLGRDDQRRSGSIAPGTVGHGARQKASIFCLPPGIDYKRLTFADDLVVPPPNLRLDRFANRGQVLEVLVVL